MYAQFLSRVEEKEEEKKEKLDEEEKKEEDKKAVPQPNRITYEQFLSHAE